MSNGVLPPALQALADKGAVTAADVVGLRRAVYGDGFISRAEAEAIIELDRAVERAAPEWTDFLLEAVTDHLVRQAEPEGYLSQEDADWLIAAVSRDGLVTGATGLELLIKVLDAAVSAPPGLSAFVLAQVAAAVLDGEGPLARGGRLVRGVISRDEVDLLRRVLYASGSSGALAVSREEAEVLFDLNDRSAEGENDPAWSDLFVKAIANHLMAARGYRTPSREDALRREAWLDAPSDGVGGIFSGALSGLLAGSLKSTWAAWKQDETTTRRSRALDAETLAAESVTSEEAAWLVGRIGRDGVLHQNEKALLRFLREENPVLDPLLRDLIEKAA